MLSLSNLRVLYDSVIEGVRDVSLDVPAGAIVALLGANGAGKSTVLKAISQVLYAEHGEIADGRITFDGQDVTHMSAQQVVRAGLVQVPEGRRLFDTLTVEENLLAGAAGQSATRARDGIDRVFGLFSELTDHRRRTSGLLSGGQQQMVAIGRALMGSPRLLMLDEPSLGLAPQISEKILGTVARLSREEGITVLLVEQNAQAALAMADHGYIMERGRVMLEGSAQSLLDNDDVREFYLGVGTQGARRSMRDIKHYRRRKRWLA